MHDRKCHCRCFSIWQANINIYLWIYLSVCLSVNLEAVLHFPSFGFKLKWFVCVISADLTRHSYLYRPVVTHLAEKAKRLRLKFSHCFSINTLYSSECRFICCFVTSTVAIVKTPSRKAFYAPRQEFSKHWNMPVCHSLCFSLLLMNPHILLTPSWAKTKE